MQNRIYPPKIQGQLRKIYMHKGDHVNKLGWEKGNET